MESSITKSLDLVTSGLLLVGLVAAVFGAAVYFGNEEPTNVNTAMSGFKPVTVEQQEAIERAREAGQKNYSYTTSYIPGIGKISDPEAYKNKQLEQLVSE